jgi:hypothetical protein
VTSLSSVRPIDAPADYVTQHAVAFGKLGEPAVGVDGDHPLPIVATFAPAAASPLSGSTSANGLLGPFVPQLGRPIWLTLSGSWSGTVQVMRSTDGGATLLPLTVGGIGWGSFGANAQEAIGEETVAGAEWYLAVALSAGTLSYSIGQ